MFNNLTVPEVAPTAVTYILLAGNTGLYPQKDESSPSPVTPASPAAMVCVWERECVYERERERVCVWVCVRESVCVCERERECVCVREREFACVKERVSVCVCVCKD